MDDLDGDDESLVQEARIVVRQLAEPQIGTDGRILEWNDEFIEEDPLHRHLSHLYELHPGTGITGFIAVAAGMTGNATAADMTPSNIHTFEICAFYVPLILIVLSLLVFMFKVKIDEKMHAKIVKELEAKLASGEIVDDEAQTAETVEAIDEEAKTLTE